MKNYHLLNSTNESPPTFLKKLTDAVMTSWDSLGSVACKLKEISNNYYEVVLFPALREVYGGKTDGEVIFPGFHFNVGRFIHIFDKSPAPKVTFDSLRKDFIPHLMFRGFIDGVALKIFIMERPPQGQTVSERVYASGPNKGQVEQLNSKFTEENKK